MTPEVLSTVNDVLLIMVCFFCLFTGVVGSVWRCPEMSERFFKTLIALEFTSAIFCVVYSITQCLEQSYGWGLIYFVLGLAWGSLSFADLRGLKTLKQEKGLAQLLSLAWKEPPQEESKESPREESKE